MGNLCSAFNINQPYQHAFNLPFFPARAHSTALTSYYCACYPRFSFWPQQHFFPCFLGDPCTAMSLLKLPPTFRMEAKSRNALTFRDRQLDHNTFVPVFESLRTECQHPSYSQGGCICLLEGKTVGYMPQVQSFDMEYFPQLGWMGCVCPHKRPEGTAGQLFQSRVFAHC